MARKTLKEYRDEARAAGKCTDCLRRKAAPEKRRCYRCLKKQREAVKSKRDEKRLVTTAAVVLADCLADVSV